MAEFVSALMDPSLPLQGKIKVARYLWGEGNLLPPERNALMLKWACQELCSAYNKKTKSPPSHVTRSQLWRSLGTVLEAESQEEEVSLDLTSLSSHLFQVWGGGRGGGGGSHPGSLRWVGLGFAAGDVCGFLLSCC